MTNIMTHRVAVCPGYLIEFEWDLDVPEEREAWQGGRDVGGPLSYNPLVGFKDEIDYDDDEFDEEGFLKFPSWNAPHIYCEEDQEGDELIERCVRCFSYGYGPLCDKHRKEITDGLVRE